MITIISKQNCQWCDKAEALLQEKQVSYKKLEIGLDISRKTVVDMFPTMKTVPIIYNGDILVGGYIELVERLNTDPLFGKILLQE